MINKPELTEKEIQQNYEEVIKFVSDTFSGERKEKILFMFSENELGLELATAPASMNEEWHNCFSGGFGIHSMNVIKVSFGIKKLFKMMGGNVDFTDEELSFSGLFHDLGKLGMPHEGPYYIPQDEDWKRKRGEIYKMNPNIQYMDVTDRALFILQYYGIKTTWKEVLGIRLSDGLYKESNKAYLVQFKTELFLKTNLPRIIHIADYISSCSERDLINSLPNVEPE